jgi:hypothetical protein
MLKHLKTGHSAANESMILRMLRSPARIAFGGEARAEQTPVPAEATAKDFEEPATGKLNEC